LLEAGVLGPGGQLRTRGIRCLANDGHECFSLGEQTIDNLLHEARIPHEREPVYPEGRYRADFLIGSTLVEYLGLAGDDAYDTKTELKRKMAARHGVAMIELRAEDLNNLPQLLERLRPLADA
jgi:hypothetical protein